MKFVLHVIVFLLIGMNGAFAAYGELRGIVKDSLSDEPVKGIALTLYSGVYQFQTLTDEKGQFIFKHLPCAKYELHVQHPEYHSQIIRNVAINHAQISFVQLSLLPENPENAHNTALCKEHKQTISSAPTPGTLIAIEAREIMHTAIERGPLEAIASFAPRVVQIRPLGPLNFNGSRSDATLFMIDGVKVIGEAFVPQMGIREVVVMSGGIPAEFGDTTSGVVYITTKSFE